jgi:hypothetical protein
MDNKKQLKEIVGCIHIHSVYSDGTGTIPYIAGVAREVGLDFIMMTDHNNLRALFNGEEKWYGTVLTIIGYEINDIDDSNHYLAFGLKEEINKNLSAPEYVKQVWLNGGIGIIAHPDEERNIMLEHPPFPWTAWDSSNYQGIEIWNQMSEWMEGLTPWNKLWRFLNPRRSIQYPKKHTLARWDDVNKDRKVVGIGGVDAHAHKHKMFGGMIEVTIFKYKVQFQTVRTHLLLPRELIPGMDVNEAKQLVYQALKDCRVFISNFYNGDARGFRFYGENNDGFAHIGDSLSFRKNTSLFVKLPASAEVQLIHNGQIFAERQGVELEFPIETPGLYRVEVFRQKRAWIFSNHIRIMSEGK